MRLIGFSFVLLGFASVASCSLTPEDLVLEPCPLPVVDAGHGGNGGEGGSAAEGGGGANQGGMGGDVGPAPECVMDSDCVGVLEAPDPRCGALRCTAEQKCAVEITEGPIASQRYGNCNEEICNALGEVISVGLPDDFFNDANPCTIDFCENGPQNVLNSNNLQLPNGVPCPGLGDGYCYEGQCVECIATDPGATCKVGGYACDFFWCVDFAQCQGNQCGGVCAPCPAGVGCQQNSDCISGVCNAGMCALSTCSDGVKNDDESGIDCGGSNCLPCPDGEGCAMHSDCLSNVCMFGVCQVSSCVDGVQNGDEAGVDCGGTGCGACVAMP